jgi:hypothetical protein
LPFESAVVVELEAPVRATVAPLPMDAGEIAPDMDNNPAGAGRISTMLRLYRSAVGDVSLIVTVVPLSGVGFACICTQYVSPAGVRYW